MNLEKLKIKELSEEKLNTLRGGMITTGPVLHPAVGEAATAFACEVASAIGEGFAEAAETLGEAWDLLF